MHKFFLTKRIARRLVNLGVPIKDACNFAHEMNEGNMLLLVRDEKTRKPDFIALVKSTDLDQ